MQKNRGDKSHRVIVALAWFPMTVTKRWDRATQACYNQADAPTETSSFRQYKTQQAHVPTNSLH